MCDLTGPCTCMTAADQTPATDSERDERLRGIQERVDHHAPEEFGSETVGWLLAEHARLTALLAEQAATIETPSELDALPSGSVVLDGKGRASQCYGDAPARWWRAGEVMMANPRTSDRVLRYGPVTVLHTAALGSQRTEGQ